MARRPTVLTPKPERASRAKPKPVAERPNYEPLPGRRYRVRQLGAVAVCAYSDDLFELELEQAELTERGIESIIEQHMGAVYGPLPKPIVTVAELGRLGLARQHDTGGWVISPEGYERLRAANG